MSPIFFRKKNKQKTRSATAAKNKWVDLEYFDEASEIEIDIPSDETIKRIRNIVQRQHTDIEKCAKQKWNC